MKTNNLIYILPALLLLVAGIFTACERDLEDLEPAQFPTNGDVFINTFTGGMEYAAFGGSKPTAFQVVSDEAFEGEASMRFAVPDAGDPEGAYAGGTFFLTGGRDLSGYNVLTFWARASKSATIDVLGFGNDLADNTFQSALPPVAVNTNWQKYFIPIPDPAKLTEEKGMFFYSEGPEDGLGYTFWIDEVRYENLGTVTKPQGYIFNGEDRVITGEAGSLITPEAYAIANLPTGVNQRVNTTPAFFEFISSNPSVATADQDGNILILGAGEAVITATLGGEDAIGSLTVTSTGAPVAPQTAAPTPDYPADEVIAVYSNTYDNIPVDFYNGFWEFSTTQNDNFEVDGTTLIRYTDLNFVGIQFTSPTIDITGTNRFRIDIWTPIPIEAGTNFNVLLYDFGPNNTFDNGPDDSSHELTFTAPQLEAETWVTIDVPLSDFTGLTGRQNLAQVVLSATNIPTVFVDNILFYEGEGGGTGGGDQPTVAAPNPTAAAADVISLFSDAYDDVPVDTWRTDWSMADFADVQVAGNATKRYTNLSFVGIETVMNQIDASEMETFHFDLWTPNATVFKVKLVDFGPDGMFEGGDDTEHELTFEAPAQNQWVSYDLPLADFVGLTNRNNIAQFIFAAEPVGGTTAFIDNIYFSRAGMGGGDEPTMAAPMPTDPAANVISLFSDAYTDVGVDTWRTDWSMADFADVQVAGNATKLYTNLNFVGIETTGANLIDASAMTHFRFDYWSPNATVFKVKLVDFGPDGQFEGGDDTEHELIFMAPPTSSWQSYDLPLADFTGLMNRNNIAQLIFAAEPVGGTTVYIDNVYFRN